MLIWDFEGSMHRTLVATSISFRSCSAVSCPES